jgi:hypothetical protein
VATRLIVLPLTWVSWDIRIQRLYRYFQVLCLINSKTQSFTNPVIPPKKYFLLVANTNAIPCILQTLKHVEEFKLHNLKNIHISSHKELRSHFLYIAKSIQTTVSTFVIYFIGITIFPIVYVLGWYNYNNFHKSTT